MKMSSVFSKRRKVTDFSRANLKKIDLQLEEILDSTSLILDDNRISDFTQLTLLKSLEKLSVARNGLESLKHFSALFNLKVLDLKNNCIESIEGISSLTQLEWLCLAGNNIKVVVNLQSNGLLRYLDLSDNHIEEFSDLTSLIHLKILLFHGNEVRSLKNVSRFLPPSIQTLTVAENKLNDLTEVQLLQSLPFLEDLTLFGNPFTSDVTGQYVDYRPYAICCCKNLQKLDGSSISQADKHSANIFEAEGHLKMLQPGQHIELTRHLLEASPGYSPTYSKMPRKARSKERKSSTGVNTSLLESESVHLPLIYDSPPKSKQSSNEDSRPYTAPAAPNFDVTTRQALISDERWSLKTTDVSADLARRLENSILSPLPSRSSPERSIELDHTGHQGREFKPAVGNEKHAIEIRNEGSESGDLFIAKFRIEEVNETPENSIRSDHYSRSNGLRNPMDENHGEMEAGKLAGVPMENSLQTSVSLTADEAASLLHLAAAMIQACIRGFLQRRRYLRQLKMHKAATKIQAVWKGYFARNRDLKTINIMNEVKVRRLTSKISFLETKISRTKMQSKRNRLLIVDALRIFINEINLLRERQSELEATRKIETDANNELRQICLGLQNEVYNLRSFIENGRNEESKISSTDQERKRKVEILQYGVCADVKDVSSGQTSTKKWTYEDKQGDNSSSLNANVLIDRAINVRDIEKHHSKGGRDHSPSEAELTEQQTLDKDTSFESMTKRPQDGLLRQGVPDGEVFESDVEKIQTSLKPYEGGVVIRKNRLDDALRACSGEKTVARKMEERFGREMAGKDKKDDDKLKETKKASMNETFNLNDRREEGVEIIVDDLVEKGSLIANRVIPVTGKDKTIREGDMYVGADHTALVQDASKPTAVDNTGDIMNAISSVTDSAKLRSEVKGHGKVIVDTSPGESDDEEIDTVVEIHDPLNREDFVAKRYENEEGRNRDGESDSKHDEKGQEIAGNEIDSPVVNQIMKAEVVNGSLSCAPFTRDADQLESQYCDHGDEIGHAAGDKTHGTNADSLTEQLTVITQKSVGSVEARDPPQVDRSENARVEDVSLVGTNTIGSVGRNGKGSYIDVKTAELGVGSIDLPVTGGSFLSKYSSTNKRRRTLFPNVFAEDSGIDSQTVQLNQSADSKSCNRPTFFSPLIKPTISQLSLGHSEGSQKTEKSLEGGQKEKQFSGIVLGRQDIERRELYSYNRDQDLDRDIRSVYREVTSYHGTLARETGVDSKSGPQEGQGSISKESQGKSSSKADPPQNVASEKTLTGSKFISGQLPRETKDILRTGSDVSTGSVTVGELRGISERVEDRYCSAEVVEEKKDSGGAFDNDTIVAVDESFLRKTRTSTPVKSLEESCNQGDKDNKMAFAAKKISSPLNEVPDCLYNMPRIVPMTRTDKDASPGIPMFVDESTDSVNDSFTV